MTSAPVAVGAKITVTLDADRRRNLSRCHSLTHLGMAAIKAFVPGYESKGADIAEDAATLTLYLRGDRIPDPLLVGEIDRLMRSLIFKTAPIRVERARSMADAARTYARWRVDPDNQLTGKVRVIHIEGIDANPCSGSHVADTAAIGPFEIRGCRLDGRGVIVMTLRRLDDWMYWYG